MKEIFEELKVKIWREQVGLTEVSEVRIKESVKRVEELLRRGRMVAGREHLYKLLKQNA